MGTQFVAFNNAVRNKDQPYYFRIRIPFVTPVILHVIQFNVMHQYRLLHTEYYCAYPLQACSLLACVTCAALLVFIIIEYLRLRKHESKQRAEYKYRNYDSL